MLAAKTQRKGKACKNRTEESPWTGVRTSGETNMPFLASPICIGQVRINE